MPVAGRGPVLLRSTGLVDTTVYQERLPLPPSLGDTGAYFISGTYLGMPGRYSRASKTYCEWHGESMLSLISEEKL